MLTKSNLIRKSLISKMNSLEYSMWKRNCKNNKGKKLNMKNKPQL